MLRILIIIIILNPGIPGSDGSGTNKTTIEFSFSICPTRSIA
ncbi:MAG: hypothetical protein ACFFA0_11015 [Promethearchaeota archaeon]